MNHRKSCEICNIYYSSETYQGKMLMACFPANKDRCKLWIKLVGKKDLANLPIVKLRRKHICANHFSFNHFNRDKSKLIKSAFPSLNLSRPPLEDHLLENFPTPFGKITGTNNKFTHWFFLFTSES
ncbi:hypothetical protein ABMA27_000183 [Loxostege sticticalis]|uniref:THAP-type domain-containing protein n=1 Tax=Loxostege sticticalis TaxID=481309 RepID=A0ABR3IMJ2_LOXSC